jgi:hypothetical protein
MVPKMPTMTTANQYVHGWYRPRLSWSPSAITNTTNVPRTAITGLTANTR